MRASLTPAVEGSPTVLLAAEPTGVGARRVARGWCVDVEFDVPEALLDPEAILAHSAGFVVELEDGAKLGVVERVVLDDDGHTAELQVCTVAGLRTRLVPYDAGTVASLHPQERRLVLRAAAASR